MAVTLVGVDAAVDPRNNSLVRAEAIKSPTSRFDLTLKVHASVRPQNDRDIVCTLSEWCVAGLERGAVLLCVDAPLGWPRRLPIALGNHTAGRAVLDDANGIFRRYTDWTIAKRVGKTPLDVGADRIARAAHATLGRLEAVGNEIQRVTGVEITLPLAAEPIAWTALEQSDNRPSLNLLETYPAGWLVSEGIDSSGYRPRQARDKRNELVRNALAAARCSYTVEIAEECDVEAFTARADDLDALVCLFCGMDVLLARSPAPSIEFVETARIEGWIWCK